VAIALLALPLAIRNEYYVNLASQILIYALLAVSLNILLGEALALGFGEDCVSSGIQLHREACPFKVVAHQSGNVRIIFNNGDVRFHGRYCSCNGGLDLASGACGNWLHGKIHSPVTIRGRGEKLLNAEDAEKGAEGAEGSQEKLMVPAVGIADLDREIACVV